MIEATKLKTQLMPATLTQVKIFTGMETRELEGQVATWVLTSGNLLVSASACRNTDGSCTLTVVYIPSVEQSRGQENKQKDTSSQAPAEGKAEGGSQVEVAKGWPSAETVNFQAVLSGGDGPTPPQEPNASDILDGR